MDIKDVILNLASNQHVFGTAEIIEKTKSKFSRQYVSRILNNMVHEGELVRSGNTKTTQYTLPSNALWMNQIVSETLENTNLNEDLILGTVQKSFLGFARLPINIQHIFNYSFSEMLNNAIEHSQSKQVVYEVFNDSENIGFTINDTGIGIFANIQKTRNLTSEIESIQDILKGKTTTAEKYHSGEGVFFTSKVADLFLIDSHNLRLRVDGLIPDVFIEELKSFITGTTITWKIKKDSNRLLSDIFKTYQSNDSAFVFDKTSVLVKLYTIDTEYVSRSQARRLLSGLNKFTKIVLDFENVKTVGQGFADEIFRVFKTNNPDIEIQYKNAIDPVLFMIKHAME